MIVILIAVVLLAVLKFLFMYASTAHLYSYITITTACMSMSYIKVSVWLWVAREKVWKSPLVASIDLVMNNFFTSDGLLAVMKLPDLHLHVLHHMIPDLLSALRSDEYLQSLYHIALCLV
jgi:hypothetical protein